MQAWLLIGAAAFVHAAEIRDVMKSGEIDRVFARTRSSAIVHEGPGYTISFHVLDARGRSDTGRDADQVLFIRRGQARVRIGGSDHTAGAGDLIHLPRATAHEIEPSGRLEFIAVRIFPDGSGLPARTGFLSPRRMPDVVTKAAIADTFAKFDANQPMHAARNFTMNYVIYSGRSGPWESHRGCVDIYFIHVGEATARLGGDILKPREETPGEIRGDGVRGAREHRIGPGDLVVIPRNGAHHMQPSTPKLGYLLVKVWAE